MCIEYRSRYACQCVAKILIGLQSCNHRKFIDKYEKDGSPETAALVKYFNERCKAESTTSYIERTDRCGRCKRARRGCVKAEEWEGIS